jgi:hypothetical protein
MTTSATDTELCPYTSIHKEKEKEKKKKKEEEEESAKDLKTLHRITFSTFTPVSVASEDSIAVEVIKASIPPPPAASILPKFSFLLVAVEGSRSSPIPKGWI